MTTAITIASTGIGVALALYFLVVKRNNDERQQKTKEQEAKASFRVRRSNLMTMSGRGNNKRAKRHGNKRVARQGHRHTTQSFNSDECTHSSWLCKLMSSLKQTISYMLSSISFGTKKHVAPEQSSSSSTLPRQNIHTKQQSMKDYYIGTIVVGLDCEMVGGGRGGWKSMLARCSVVTLDYIPNETTCGQEGDAMSNSTTAKHRTTQQQKVTSLDQNLIVLYDKYVIPRGKITDYRTEWSGITKDTYKQDNSPIPIVSFNQCQNEISQLFSSIEGKKVIVVGHALDNDFEALEIEHPIWLTRDTAFYPPYMRRVRRKMYPRKLSTLTSELLDIEIQQKSKTPASSEELSAGKSMKNASMVGHSSVEDATAALRLYWHMFTAWEHSLGQPLFGTPQMSQCWHPLKMYLDGCNLPIGMRGVNFKELIGNPSAEKTDHNNVTILPSKSFRLTSKKRDSNHTSSISTIDWIPTFQSALSPSSAPKLDNITIMFDGAKFSSINSNAKSKEAHDGFETKVFCLDSIPTSESEDHGPIRIEITKIGESADDVLFHRCSADGSISENSAASDLTPKMISLDKVIDMLAASDNYSEADVLSHYIVIRRKAGGTKTHRKLFDKFNLRRPTEGALCLSGLTPGLQREGLKTARELQRERSIERVIECELRRRDELRFVIVTDDIFLTDRLVRNGALVLSYRQLTNMF